MGQIKSISDVISMLRRRFLVVLLVVVAGAMLSVWWALGQKKVYEATSVAQIETPAVIDTTRNGGAGTSKISHRLRILEQQLMSRDSLIAVIDRNNLYADAPLTLKRKVDILRESVRVVQVTDPNAPFGAPRVPTGLFITVSDTDAEMAASLANQFLDKLVRLNGERASSIAAQNLQFFKAEATRVEGEIKKLEAEISQFKQKNANYLPAGIAAQRTEMATLKTNLLTLQQQVIALDSNQSRQRSEQIKRQRVQLLNQQGLIEARIAQINAAIAASPEVERQYGILTRKQQELRERYSAINRRATDAEMGQTLKNQQQFERIEVLEKALVPEHAVSGSRKRTVLIGTFLSGVLGLGIAFILELLNPAIRTRAHVEAALGIKPVVAIPHLGKPPGAGRRRLMLIGVGLLAVLGALWALVAPLRDLVKGLLPMLGGRRRV